MKKSGMTRRNFMKGLAAATASTAIIPTWAGGLSEKAGYGASPEMNNPAEITLPPLFDCNKYIGPGFPKRPDFPKAVDLLAHMDRLSIDRAVAWHTEARYQDPMKGNEQLINEIKSPNVNDRIIPSFIISPSFITDNNSFNRFLGLVKQYNIRAFHFYPGKSGVKLKDIYPVVKALQPYKPVLFLDSFENLGDDLEMIKSFSKDFPQVSMVFTNAMWVFLDKLFKLMESCPNIFVDTSLQHIFLANEYIVKRFGVERLIFGAGYKSNNGAAIAALAHNEITLQQAAMVAHGNLERLLGTKSPLTGSRSITGDRLWHRLLRKESLGNDFIDAHTHLCRTTAKWEDHDQMDIDSHAKQAIRQMDSLGVHSMIIAEYTVYPPDLKGGKTYIEDHLSAYGDRFHGYFSGLAFKTEKNDLGRLLKRMDDLFSRSYYVGFKMHDSHWNIPCTDPDFTPLWKYADKHRLPILLHTWNDKVDAPKMLTEIVPRYPNAIFILGHSGNTDRHDAEILALQNPNVYLEWCGSFLNPDDWRETFERLGNRRILYGSDFISWESRWGHDPAWEMGRLLSMDVPDETLLPILGSNMKEILKKRI